MLIHTASFRMIEDSPRDIGTLIKEVPEDIRKECEADICAKLWEWAWPHIRRQVTRGLPEWYKNELLKKQFASPGIDGRAEG